MDWPLNDERFWCVNSQTGHTFGTHQNNFTISLFVAPVCEFTHGMLLPQPRPGTRPTTPSPSRPGSPLSLLPLPCRSRYAPGGACCINRISSEADQARKEFRLTPTFGGEPAPVMSTVPPTPHVAVSMLSLARRWRLTASCQNSHHYSGAWRFH